MFQTTTTATETKKSALICTSHRRRFAVFSKTTEEKVNKHKFGRSSQKRRMKAENKIKDEDKFRRLEVRPKAGGKVGRPAESASQLTNGVRNVTEVKLVTLTVFHPFLVIFLLHSLHFAFNSSS
jgi:hypothetical protein